MPEFMNDETWGNYGNEPPCTHLVGLRDYLMGNNMIITNDFTEPHDWCSVYCSVCRKTYEVILKPRNGWECDSKED